MTIKEKIENKLHKILNAEERFMVRYGIGNCSSVKFRPYEKVLESMNKAYPTEAWNKDVLKFVIDNQNKQLLCYKLESSLESAMDVFVYGDNNIPFTKDCFKWLDKSDKYLNQKEKTK